MTAFAFDLEAVAETSAAQHRLVAVHGSVDAPGAAGVRTLDAALTATWSLVAAGRIAACPVCSEPLSPPGSAGAAGARCGGCGSSLD